MVNLGEGRGGVCSRTLELLIFVKRNILAPRLDGPLFWFQKVFWGGAFGPCKAIPGRDEGLPIV